MQLPALRCPALQCLSSWQQQCSSCLSSASWHAHRCPCADKTGELSTQLILSFPPLHSSFAHFSVSCSLPPAPPAVKAVTKWLCGVLLLTRAKPRHPWGFFKKRKSTGSVCLPSLACCNNQHGRNGHGHRFPVS